MAFWMPSVEYGMLFDDEITGRYMYIHVDKEKDVHYQLVFPRLPSYGTVGGTLSVHDSFQTQHTFEARLISPRLEV